MRYTHLTLPASFPEKELNALRFRATVEAVSHPVKRLNSRYTEYAPTGGRGGTPATSSSVCPTASLIGVATDNLRAFPVFVRRAAGFSPRDLPGLDAGTGVQKPAHENDNSSSRAALASSQRLFSES